MHKKQWNKK